MKKMIITAVVLMFGAVVSAQTVPGQPVPAKPAAPAKTDVVEKDQRKVQPAPQGIKSEQPIPTKSEQPAEDRAKANEHVKSSPDMQRQGDTASVKKPRQSRRP